MFKKSVPIILGALFLATTAASAITITCPLTYTANNLNINGQEFTLDYTSPIKLIFAGSSKVESVKDSDEVRAICAYKIEGFQKLTTLSFVSKLNCYVRGHNTPPRKGKPGEFSPSSCSGSDDCRIITCD